MQNVHPLKHTHTHAHLHITSQPSKASTTTRHDNINDMINFRQRLNSANNNKWRGMYYFERDNNQERQLYKHKEEVICDHVFCGLPLPLKDTRQIISRALTYGFSNQRHPPYSFLIIKNTSETKCGCQFVCHSVMRIEIAEIFAISVCMYAQVVHQINATQISLMKLTKHIKQLH